MKKLLAVLVTLPIALSCHTDNDSTPTPDKPSEQKTINLVIDGISRSLVIYLPEGYNNAGKMPMILALHGGGGSPTQFLADANFRPIADRDKVILVYPAGIQNSWNSGMPTNANLLGIDDVSFIDQLCDYMIANYAVEATKIYATGHSNGGFMASRLACELSNRIAAIAVSSATIEQTTVFPNCNPANPVPAIYMHGTADNFVPIGGGNVTIGSGGLLVSHQDAIAKWVSINNCNPTPIITNLPDIANDGTTITETKYINGTNGSEVISYVILNGGHTWPHGNPGLPESIVGKVSKDMNGVEVAWAFFKRFHR